MKEGVSIVLLGQGNVFRALPICLLIGTQWNVNEERHARNFSFGIHGIENEGYGAEYDENLERLSKSIVETNHCIYMTPTNVLHSCTKAKDMSHTVLRLGWASS